MTFILMAWLGVLTVVVLLLVRQLGLVTLRLDAVGRLAPPHAAGLEPGTLVPLEPIPTSLRGRLDDELIVFVATATCSGCKEMVAASVDVFSNDSAIPVLAIVPGESNLAARLADQASTAFDVLRDPDATAMADALNLRTTLVALHIKRSIVLGTADVDTPDRLQRFIEASRSDETDRMLERLGELPREGS